MATPRLMVVVFAALGVVVAAVVALALNSWWILVAVLLVHGIATALVVGIAFRRAADTGGKPDPVTEARIEEEQAGRRGSPHAV
jgi:membrane protein implicated in regulation of membrane protease activity